MSAKIKARSSTPLPGFEFTVTPARPGEMDMSDAKRYTGEIVFRDHPDVFRAVAAALFMDGLSVRSTAARYRVSVNTVRAIRDMAIEGATSDAGRAAFFIRSKADRLQGIIRTRALEVLYDRLTDPAQASEIPVDTLMRMAELGVPADGGSKTPAAPGHEDVIDVDCFDDLINGLDATEKNSRGQSDDADQDPADEGAAGAEKCSTANTETPYCSFGLSDNNQCLQGFRDSACKTLCNSPESSADLPSVEPPPLAAEKGLPGGGGAPGGARAGVLI